MVKKTMNILFVAHEVNLGGATRGLMETILYFKNKDAKILVLVPRKEGPLCDYLRENKISYISSKYFFWNIPDENIDRIFLQKLALKSNAILARFIKRRIKKYNTNIIYTNTSICNFGLILSQILTVPHIWHIREIAIPGYMNRDFVYNYSRVKKEFEKSKSIIFSSNAIKEIYMSIFDGLNGTVIYDGIKPTLSNNKLINKNEDFNLLITGFICRQKGQKEAIQAIKLLKTEGYEHIKLYIAGTGDTDEIISFVERNNLSNNIVMLGQVDDMLNLRRRMDIELVCSESEGFGRVTVEAMMCELPIIGSNRGATSEIIVHGVNGFLYEKGNVNELADRILELYYNDDLRKDMGKAGREIALKKFDLENQLEKVYRLCENSI